MTRRIDIDDQGRLLSIAFPYDRELLDVVRALPQRRFDRDEKAWFVPAQHIEQVITRLHPLSFELSAPLLAYCQEQGAEVDKWMARAVTANRPVIDLEAMPAGTWSVAMLNEQVRSVLHDAFREEVWLAGELQGYDRNRATGHAFFELVHRPFQGANPTAQVAAVLWEPERELIERALYEDGGSVRLRDGLIARFLARVDFYTGQGRYQLTLRDLDLAYTSGTIQQNRERILRDLEQRAIAELNLMRPWPICPIRIGLITSHNSDAYVDFVHELQQSGYGFMVDVFHVNVQGAHTEASVLKALDYFARHAKNYDALALVRGGGARSDLAYFDTAAIGEAVCQHPLKVVVGIGHQRDVCLLDFIAYSEKTPTAAAQFLVDRVQAYMEQLARLQAQIIEVATTRQEEASHQLEHLGLMIERSARHILTHQSRHLARQGYQITRAATDVLTQASRKQERLKRQIPQAALSRQALAKSRYEAAKRRLSQERVARGIVRDHEQLDRAQATLERASAQALHESTRALNLHQQRLRLLDPRRILERGFAIVRQRDLLLRDAHLADAEHPIEITLAKGQLLAKLLPSPLTADEQDHD